MPADRLVFAAAVALAAVCVACLGRLLDRSAPADREERPQPGLTAAEHERLRSRLCP